MNVAKHFWPYVLQMANFVKNRTVFLKGEDKLPYEAFNGEAWDLSSLRVPFCKVWFHVETDDKLDSRAHEGTLVGYTKSRNHYIVLD